MSQNPPIDQPANRLALLEGRVQLDVGTAEKAFVPSEDRSELLAQVSVLEEEPATQVAAVALRQILGQPRRIEMHRVYSLKEKVPRPSKSS